MRRFLLISLAIILAIPVILLGVVTWLINDQAWLKKQASKYSIQFTGRELAVDGALDLSLGSVIRLEATGIRFANAEWAENEDMATIGRLVVTARTGSLLSDNPSIPIIQLSDCRLELLETVEHGANWDLLESDEEETGSTEIIVDNQSLVIENCAFTYNSEQKEQSHEVLIERFSQELTPEDRWETEAAATVNDQPLDLAGWVGPAGAALNGGYFEHDIKMSWGKVQLLSSGTIEDLYQGQGANIQTHLTGPALEQVLERLDLPPVSSGPFNFNLKLDSTGPMTQLTMNGSLGALDLIANGESDSITQPSKGHLNLDLEGHSLQKLGHLLDIDGLVDEAYRLQLNTGFRPGVVEIQSAQLDTGEDRLKLLGEWHMADAMAGTALEFSLHSPEIGRWAPALGQPAMSVGALNAQGELTADQQGNFSTNTRLVQSPSELELVGSLGRLESGLSPDLQIKFGSSDVGPLASLVGYPDFPSVPVSLEGKVSQQGKTVELTDLLLDFNGDRARINGQLQLEQRLSGSDVELALDIANMAALGTLFGHEGLPAEPLKVKAEIRPQGKGLKLSLEHREGQDLRLNVDASIPDIEQPLALDATFDLALPSLAMLKPFLPEQELPDVPVSASGQLQNSASQTLLRDVSGALGQLEATIEGALGHDETFDVNVRAQAPDASKLDDLLGSMPPVSVSFAGRIHGTPRTINLSDSNATLGESDVAGDLIIDLGDRPQINGDLTAKLLDLTHWSQVEQEETPPETSREKVFTNEPIFQMSDLGFGLELDLQAEMVRLTNTSFADLTVKASLGANHARIDPFSYRPPRGSRVSGRFELDQSGEIPRLQLSLSGKDIRSGILAAKGQDIATMPETDIFLDLSGQGRTQHELASSLNGKARVYSGPGKLAAAGVSLLFSDFLTELSRTLNPFAETNEYTSLECLVAAADVTDGVVKLGPIVMNTVELGIFSEGTIDLGTENLDINFSTKPKQGLGLSAGVLINPLTKVGGTLASPSIQLDPQGTVVSGSVAVATGGLSLLAKSFSDRFLASKDPCGDAQAEIDTRDSN